MTLDPFVFFVLLIIVYWVLEDVVGLFLYASVLVGVFFNLGAFVNVPTGLINLFQFVISLIALASMGKFYHNIGKKWEETKRIRGD